MRKWLLAALVCVAAPTHAIPIQLDFTGRIEDPRSVYFGQSVEASFTFDRVLSFDYQVGSSENCISGVDATLGISSAYVTLNGTHISAAPSTLQFRADGMCSGFYAFASIYEGDTQIGGFQVDLSSTSLNEVLAAEDPFSAVFRPSGSGSSLSYSFLTGAGGAVSVSQVSEPATFALLAIGALGLALAHRSRAEVLTVISRVEHEHMNRPGA